MSRSLRLSRALLVCVLWSPAHAAPAADLAAQLATLAARAKGTVAIAVTHIESGRSTTVHADVALPTFSVMKLPVAVAVLTDVAAGRLALDKTVRVTRPDVLPGGAGSEQRWADVPKDLSVAQLLDLSLVYSDNTSSDKLMELVGGPAGAARRLQALHIDGLQVRSNYHTDAQPLNVGSADAIARFLTRLWKGQLLARPQLDLVMDMMIRSPNGARRLRGQLPPGTVVADKTGTGADGRATNDVGFITLPPGQGHLAIAVLISGSPLPLAQQEDLIAAIARAAYDAHVVSKPPAP